MSVSVISDIQEDVVNLQNALDQILQLNVDKIVCLGDIVGFDAKHYNYEETRNAQQCIHILKERLDIVVAGNHDLNTSGSFPFFMTKVGFPENWYAISMDEKEKLYENMFFLYKDEADINLNKSDIKFLKDLNSWEILEADTIKLLLSHFIYPDINGNLSTFVNNKEGFSLHFEFMNKLGVNISFVGHAHLEGVGIVGKRGLKINKFGIHSLKDEPQVILCPTIAKGKHKNGFVIFDTHCMSIEVVGL